MAKLPPRQALLLRALSETPNEPLTLDAILERQPELNRNTLYGLYEPMKADEMLTVDTEAERPAGLRGRARVLIMISRIGLLRLAAHDRMLQLEAETMRLEAELLEAMQRDGLKA